MFGLSLVWDFAHVEWAKRQGDKHICKRMLASVEEQEAHKLNKRETN